VPVGWKSEWFAVGFSFPFVNRRAFLINKGAFLGNIVLGTSKNSNVPLVLFVLLLKILGTLGTRGTNGINKKD
jgi:hypothetical protein